MRRTLSYVIATLVTLVMLTACEKEEDVAMSMSGVWETTDALFPRTFQEKTIYPVKTVFRFNQDHEGVTTGDGIAVEFFDNELLPVAYYNIRWETWTRQNGDVGVEIIYSDEPRDKFITTEYNLSEKEFSGQCLLNDRDTKGFRFVRGNEPDVSGVKFWGYDELSYTWHPVTYEGQMDIRREYKGNVYQPTNVIITFDVDPLYNDCIRGDDKAYIKEVYEDAPWGTYLADSIRHWNIDSAKNLHIYLAHSKDSWGDYEIQNTEISNDALTGEVFIKTNVFSPFHLKRIPNPDWSAVREWGITNRIQL